MVLITLMEACHMFMLKFLKLFVKSKEDIFVLIAPVVYIELSFGLWKERVKEPPSGS